MRALALLAAVIVGGGMMLAQEPTPRVPVPVASDMARARTLIEELFGADLKAVRTPEARVRLGNILFLQARENGKEPANRFVLLEEAQRQAALAGDIALSLTWLDEMVRLFDVDPLPRRTQLVAHAVSVADSPEVARSLVNLANPFIIEALDLDRYEIARALADAALRAAQIAKDDAAIQNLRRRLQHIATLAEGYARHDEAVDRLKNDPDDVDANFDLGCYYGFLKGRWDKALPLLSRGKDEVLKTLAKSDLKSPGEPDLQLALADAWWDRSFSEKEPARTALQARAAFWYARAVPRLKGLNRTKANQRIDRVAAAAEVANEPSTPVGEIRKLTGHTEEIKTVALSADGRFALSGSADLTARVWDLTTGKEHKILRGHDKQLWAVAFHPSNKLAVTSSWDGTARLWDIATGQEVRRFTHPVDVNGIALDRTGERLLVGCDNHNSYLWDVATGKQIRPFSGHNGFVYAVAISPDGKQIATSSADKTIRHFDLATGEVLRGFAAHAAPVAAIAFTPDGRGLISCGDNQPQLWDLKMGVSIRSFEGHTGYVLALALSGDGRRLVTGGDDRSIRVWEVATGKEVMKLQGHEGAITSLAISSDGRKVVSGSLDRTVRVWSLPVR